MAKTKRPRAKSPKRQPAAETSTAPASVKQSGLVANLKDLPVGPIPPPAGSMLKKPKERK